MRKSDSCKSKSNGTKGRTRNIRDGNKEVDAFFSE